jgi:integrase/recombinase XerD
MNEFVVRIKFKDLSRRANAPVTSRTRPRRKGLTADQVARLLDAPAASTMTGRRDRALLAVLIGCGLRRGEAAALTFGDIQLRDLGWSIVIAAERTARSRRVPLPVWVKALIDEWSEAALVASGRVFRPINDLHEIAGPIFSDENVSRVVKKYGKTIGLETLGACDLRRTFVERLLRAGCE